MLKNKKLIIYFCIIIIAIVSTVNLIIQASKINSPNIISLVDRWQYRIDDSPADENGNLIWLNDSLNATDWINVSKIEDIQSTDSKSIWLRTVLPDTTILSPALYIGSIQKIAQVYLNGKKIYQSGNFTNINADHFQGWYQPLINLPENNANGILSFRIWSGQSSPGLTLPVWLASENLIVKHLFITNIDKFFFVPIFIFLGIVLLIKVLLFKPNKLIFGIAVFLLGMGVFTGSSSNFIQIIFHKPRLFLTLDFFSILVFTIGGLLVAKEIVSSEYITIATRLLQIYYIFLLLSLAPVLFFIPNIISVLYTIYFIMLCITPIFVYYILIKSIKKGNKNTKLFFVGFTISTISGLIEALYHFTLHSPIHINLNLFSFHIHFMHFGAFGFVLSMAQIVNNTYSEVQYEKEIAQKEVLESEKIRELDKLKSRFFANISHEFRTPLTLIIGTAKQIIDKSKDQTAREKSQLQIQNGQRLLNLVNELLDLSQLDTGHMKLKVEPRDIVQQIKNLCDQFESFAATKSIQINFNSRDDEVIFFYDWQKIEKVILNLVANAIKFTPKNGRVNIDVVKNDNVKIIITDTGSGISPDHLPYIFDRFYQGNNGYTQAHQSNGIGLALARELVLLHQGDISVESEVGKGSRFIVTLPLEQDNILEENIQKIDDTILAIHSRNGKLFQPQKFTTVSQNNQPLSKTDKPILLVVEDNPDLCNYICEIFTEEYDTISAENGKAGMKLAIDAVPDIVISDVMMPEMDGYEFCENLKTDECTCHIPVILLTARSDSNSKIEGLTLGADDYITKPFDANELKIRAQNLIEQRKKLRQLFGKKLVKPEITLEMLPADEQFLKRISNIIEKNIDNIDLNVEWLSEKLFLSRSQLHRKIKGLTDQPPSLFIRSIRLKKAAELLKNNSGLVKEVAYRTGFSSPNHFRDCFKEEFGVSPKKYCG